MYQNSSIEIIYGTGNKAKVEAMKKIIREHDFNVSIQTLKDINFNEEIIEDGKTFEENSEIKARVIQKFCEKNNIKNKIIITDDAGLCIDKLNGEPGVYSARYAGENATQLQKIEKVLTIDDLAKGDNLFFAATGITEGDLLSGVKHIGSNRAKTQSVVMRAKTGTIRFVDAIHSLDKNEILVDLMKKYNIE